MSKTDGHNHNLKECIVQIFKKCGIALQPFALIITMLNDMVSLETCLKICDLNHHYICQ